VEEIMDGLTAIGIEYDKEILIRMIENADLSYDGSIEYPEFIRWPQTSNR
jgi:Ca2+-binding EF-hand superfamily protein